MSNTTNITPQELHDLVKSALTQNPKSKVAQKAAVNYFLGIMPTKAQMEYLRNPVWKADSIAKYNATTGKANASKPLEVHERIEQIKQRIHSYSGQNRNWIMTFISSIDKTPFVTDRQKAVISDIYKQVCK